MGLTWRIDISVTTADLVACRIWQEIGVSVRFQELRGSVKVEIHPDDRTTAYGSLASRYSTSLPGPRPELSLILGVRIDREAFEIVAGVALARATEAAIVMVGDISFRRLARAAAPRFTLSRRVRTTGVGSTCCAFAISESFLKKQRSRAQVLMD
jgi:hypothetical protein